MLQELDQTDIKLLQILQENCKYTTKELAQMVNLSTTPTFERIKRLERLGFIRGYVAVLDGERLDRNFIVFCNVSMRQINRDIAMQFAKAVQEWDEVTECYNVSGDGDYMLKVCVSSMHQYQQFVINKIGGFPHVAHIQSIFAMDTLKHVFGFPLS
ncbi:MAG: Lrp/AsnC family transcriptional regulator [Bacteroidaceae bacterium]|nr:Lrp/AsnC family transcriptional regulator [Bacteroidaceae bacterium]